MKRTLTLITIFASLISQPAFALRDNWRTGKTGLLQQDDMETSARLRGAEEELKAEMKALGDTALKLEVDIKDKIMATGATIAKSLETLKSQVKSLCDLGKSMNYQNVKFEGAVLQDEAAFDAKIRLLAAAYYANEGAELEFMQAKSAYERLSEAIKRKANELDVLKQTIDSLLDPRKSIDKGSANSAIQQAITGLDEGAKLRSDYKEETVDQMFARAAEKTKTKTFSDAETSKIKSGGDVTVISQSPERKAAKAAPAKPWYQFW